MIAALEAASRARVMKHDAPQITDPEVVEVLRVWRMMGRRMDWQALPLVAEFVGVDDIEALVPALLVVADRAEAGHG